MNKSYLIDFSSTDTYNHCIGGECDIIESCPNCTKNLILYAKLDTDDPKLHSLKFPYRYIYLFYCMRCPLAWYDFQYKQFNNGISIVEAYTEKDAETESLWQEQLGFDSIRQTMFSLQEIPDTFNNLFIRASEGETLTEKEQHKIASLTNNFAPQELGGYPIVDAFNQVSGVPYLPQNVDSPTCKYCQKSCNNSQMIFLASLTNKIDKNIVIADDGVQIIFFICPQCHSIHVQHCC